MRTADRKGLTLFPTARPTAWTSLQKIFGTAPRTRSSATQSVWARPDGWVGYWSERYGRVLARTFALRPPLDASMQEFVAYVPRPFQEALDPLASMGESTDRDGRAAPWRWHRSVTRDLLGPAGVTVGIAGLFLVLALAAFTLVGAKPTTIQPDNSKAGQTAPKLTPLEPPPIPNVKQTTPKPIPPEPPPIPNVTGK
jgi:hypothetical protein